MDWKALKSLLEKNNRGIALLMVMASVFIITTIMVEFAFKSNVQYHLALNNADRVQAYYLAESALNFSKLLIKFDREIQKQIAQYKADVQIDPLYKMFPLSSMVLRGVLAESPDGEGTVEMPETPPAQPTEEELAKMSLADKEKMEEPKGLLEQANEESTGGGLSVLQGEKAREFLSFSGDFDLEVSEEDSKFDLNIFNTLVSTQPDYDIRKRWLVNLLKIPPMDQYFEKRDDDLTPEMLAYRMMDWVDPNDTIDEVGGGTHGNEIDGYRDVDYTPKDGKFTTVDEVALVPGMTPAYLALLTPYLTIYSTVHKFNACLAAEPLVDAFVAAYSQTNTCATALDPEKDMEQIDQIARSFIGACPKPDQMAQSLDESLGISLGNASGDTDKDSDGQFSNVTAGTGSAGKEINKKDCGPFKTATMLTDERSVFQLVGRGTVGDTVVEIRTILNASGDDPTRWAFYYWRIN